MPNTIPIEIVRIRVRRAQELGLSYPQYASVLLGGHDIVGFLFTTGGLQLKLRRKLELPDTIKQKLTALTSTDLLSFSPSGEDPIVFRSELEEISGLKILASAQEPESTSWSEAKQAVRNLLQPVGLPGKSVVMIGHQSAEAKWAEAGRLAKFISTHEYFT